jgi:hypothetical protein
MTRPPSLSPKEFGTSFMKLRIVVSQVRVVADAPQTWVA